MGACEHLLGYSRSMRPCSAGVARRMSVNNAAEGDGGGQPLSDNPIGGPLPIAPWNLEPDTQELRDLWNGRWDRGLRGQFEASIVTQPLCPGASSGARRLENCLAMKLVRLAAIGFSNVPRKITVPAVMSSEHVDVELTAAGDLPKVGKYVVIAKAYTSVSAIESTSAGLLVLPERPRINAEVAIERAADLLAVTSRASRQVFSGIPSVALIPENADDQRILRAAQGLQTHGARSLSTLCTELDAKAVAGSLNDRWDGVTLMAEAYSHNRMSARYREFVRLFELAFARDFTQMDKKLVQTLRPSMGYSQVEVRAWQGLRHPFMHADGKKTSEIALESDARRVTQRMEQAAIDILLNKATWGTWSADRRETWTPEAITVDAAGTGVVRQGSAPQMEFLLLDHCCPVKSRTNSTG